MTGTRQGMGDHLVSTALLYLFTYDPKRRRTGVSGCQRLGIHGSSFKGQKKKAKKLVFCHYSISIANQPNLHGITLTGNKGEGECITNLAYSTAYMQLVKIAQVTYGHGKYQRFSPVPSSPEKIRSNGSIPSEGHVQH